MIVSRYAYLHWWVLVVGSRSGDKLERRNTERPDICLEVITGYLFHNLRSHPARCAHKSMSRLLSRQIATGREPRADTKVSNLNSTIFTKKNITSFDVSMDLAIVVEILETLRSNIIRNYHSKFKAYFQHFFKNSCYRRLV